MARTRPGGGPLGHDYGVLGARRPDGSMVNWKPGPRPAWGPPQPGKRVVYEWPATPFGHQIQLPKNPLGLYPGRVAAEGESNFYYHDQPVPLRWVSPLAAGGQYVNPAYPPVNGVDEPPVLARALWGSPRFDLQPWLQGSASFVPASFSIWRGSTLQVQMFMNNLAIRDITAELRVYAVSLTSAFDPNRLEPIDKPQDITQEFFNGSQSTVLTFPCPAPVRYWEMRLVFDVLQDEPPPIRVASVLS